MVRLRALSVAPVSLLVSLVWLEAGVIATHADVLHLEALLLSKGGLIFAASEILILCLFFETEQILLGLVLSLTGPIFRIEFICLLALLRELPLGDLVLLFELLLSGCHVAAGGFFSV